MACSLTIACVCVAGLKDAYLAFRNVFGTPISIWNEFDYQTPTFSAGYLLGRNVKWLNEYTRDLEGNHHRWLTGFIVGI
jgi:hypothetical protein